MDLTTLTYIAVGLSFALYIGIAIWAKASTTGEFYVAGKGVNPVVNGMATAADWMSAASFISMAGLIAFLGYGGSVYLMGWTGGYCLLAMLLAPYLRKYGKFTVPEFIGDRYYSKAARIVAVICLIFISFTYVAGQMRGVGIVFSRFLEVEILTGLIVGMGIVFIYAVLGGMKGITYTQVAQYCVLIVAYTIPAIFIAFQLTGNPLPQLAFGSTVNGTGEFMLDRLNQVVTELGFLEYTTTSKSTIDIFAITLALMVGTAGLPHVIVRFFTVPKVRDARSSAGWALVFIALLYTTAPAVGAMARLNLTETIQTGEVGAEDGNLVFEERPDWMKRWEATGLLKFEDKNGDGRIQYYNDANAEFAAKAAEFGWQGNELSVDRDIMVLANPEIAQLPNWVIALVAAGGIAAALSTAAGLLLVISSGVSHDILKGTFTPNMTEGQELMAGRIAAAVAILIAGYLGYNPPGFVAQVVAFAFGLAASSLFPVIIMGIFSKKVNREGAIAGMLTGLVFTMGYILAYKGVFFDPIIANTPENWLFGISPEGIGAVGMVLNFIVAFAVSKVTAEPPEHIQVMIEDIRVPKGAGSAVDH
ncbi:MULTISPECIES: sodium:solute symporter family protein [Thalassospira]|jgi:cation/acetate symporter|uniref:Sodium:solute symporter n=1 Tax=Thalassospira profundimaris TaxID=502049 RepID=A0A367VK99_9PROT|nr:MULTISPECIES: sodium:solute symporter family protein [Thalassospira]MBR9899575.1 cation acetate symporter [Rhodospirillales bacterium]KZB70734.1 cation acetate symporter [Thalassospira sp. MCCC 1A01148]MBC45515.1 cation acetate symporter [Thalassospira sp.]MBO6805664.1 cation acetate symporter [Thalassospira sp.]MBS8273656.1 cation acetate symporter [Thalassospira tepidiphila]|tara:strand:- start:3621 stop:5387 length:1767 start_codon:yes stop_codon:yes gene_type:complete